MGARAKRLSRALALIAAGAVLGSSLYAVAAKKPPKPAKREPTPAHSIRDTGVGLPRIDSQGTLGVGEFVQPVRDYHDSGSYAADLATVAGQAQAFMERQAKAVRAKAKRNCGTKPKCKPKLAIVLDIDETSLSNYDELNASSFTNAAGALVLAVGSADSPAIAPTLALYNRAKAIGVAVYFVTGRPPLVEGLTRENLTAAGYTAPDGLYMKPSDDETIPFKSNARATIEAVLKYRIIANIGDQESDLAGGAADRSFKLPNPFYFIH
jgi:HAD superfamily, subfamily IIIB (Acid phosphatase)